MVQPSTFISPIQRCFLFECLLHPPPPSLVYSKPLPSHTEHWRVRLQGKKIKKTGLCWLSNSSSHTQLVGAKTHAETEDTRRELQQRSVSWVVVSHVCSAVTDLKLDKLTNISWGSLMSKRRGGGGGVVSTYMCASLREGMRESSWDTKRKDEETEDMKKGQTAQRTTECLRKWAAHHLHQP